MLAQGLMHKAHFCEGPGAWFGLLLVPSSVPLYCVNPHVFIVVSPKAVLIGPTRSKYTSQALMCCSLVFSHWHFCTLAAWWHLIFVTMSLKCWQRLHYIWCELDILYNMTSWEFVIYIRPVYSSIADYVIKFCIRIIASWISGLEGIIRFVWNSRSLSLWIICDLSPGGGRYHHPMR